MKTLPALRLSVPRLGLRLEYLLVGLLAVALIATPVLLYFDDRVLASAGGMAFEVRFVLLLLIGGLAALVVAATNASHLPLILLPFALFVLLGVVTGIVQGLPPRWWVPPATRWATQILLAWAAYNLVRRGVLTVERLAIALILALFGPLVFGAAQLLFDLVPMLNGAYRLYGPFVGSPLNYALFLSALGLILLGTVKPGWRASLVASWREYVIVGGATVLLFFTYSRLVIVAYLACLGLLMILQRRIVVLIVAGLFGAGLLLTSDALVDQLAGRFRSIGTINDAVFHRAPNLAFQYEWTEVNMDNSVLLRVQTHFVGWEAFQRAPVFGHGLGSFVPLYEARTGRPDVAAHNDYLLYFVEMGAFGLTIYVVLQVILIWSLLFPPRWCSPETRAICGGVVASYICINVFSFLSNAYYFYEVQVWIWLGIGVALAYRRADRQRARAAAAQPL